MSDNYLLVLEKGLLSKMWNPLAKCLDFYICCTYTKKQQNDVMLLLFCALYK